MTTIIFGGGSSFGGGVQSNSPGSPTIQATAGSVTTVTGTINQPINNVSTFSSVQYGISPYTYSISSGTLPTGVTLDSNTGIISGIPTATQSSSSVTVNVTDSLGVTASTTSTVAFTVGSAIVATANSVAPVTVYTNQAISTVTPFSSVTGGTQPYWYFVSSGTLPDRVTLDPTTGQISGTPTQPYATSNVTISVRDAGGIVASTTSTISFTVILALVAMPGGTSTVFGYQSTAITSFNPFSSVTGGILPYTYYVSSGTLPTGVTIDSSSGLVSGTPTVTQSLANVVFAVKDSTNLVASTTVTVGFTVVTAISAVAGATTTVSAIQSTAITSFNAFTSVSNGYTPYVYSVSSGTLPTGVAINSSTGLVSGTPTATYATASVTFSVTDAQGYVAATTTTVSFTVNSAITATAGATTTVSQQQNTAITSFNPFASVSGGYTPYTYYTSSGTLPPGITQNTSTGLVSGTPTTAQAASNVVFAVKDSQNSVAATSVTVSFTVTASSYTINYLIVGGGGHGGGGSACGGGGGGGGGVIASSVCVLKSNPITITVGTGAGPSSGPAPAFYAGSPSSIAAPTIPALGTQTAIGGGSGGSHSLTPTGAGYTGASGGGGAHGTVAGPGGTGTPGQGFPGGSGTTVSGGGGGGAGGPGAAGTPTVGGFGGSGYTWPFNNIGYGGGGQGAGPAITPVNPTAPFGGGNGGYPGAPPLAYGTSGLTGRGGGGGAGPGLNPTGSPTTWNTGGPGTVILAMPTPNYNPSGYTPSPGITVSTAPASPTTTLITFNIITAYTPATYTYTT